MIITDILTNKIENIIIINSKNKPEIKQQKWLANITMLYFYNDK